MDTSKFSVYDEGAYLNFMNPSIVHRDLERLSGILTGIASDHEINSGEHAGLIEWLSTARQHEDKQPYKTIIDLITQATADGDFTREEVENIRWFCQQYIEQKKYYDDLTAGVLNLHGILTGISIDGKINEKELQFLNKWLDDNEYLKNTWPYDELYNILLKVMRDGVFTDLEHNDLLNFCKAITTGKENAGNKEHLSSLSTGFYQIDPSITFQEKTFCITGISKKYKRKELAEKIELYGGFIQSAVSSKLNYLVVCDEKNSCWAFTCYGRKIEEAMHQRQQGKQILIVHEFDLCDAFESQKE